MKPKHGAACNGCGFCCMVEVCAIGKLHHGEEQAAPCPSLTFENGRHWCAFVVAEAHPAVKAAGYPPLVTEALGIGRGCDAVDDAESEAWNEERTAP